MKRINLKDYYHHITTDTYIEIPKEVFHVFEEYRKAEQAYQSKIYYHNAYYSLDCRDDIEVKAICEAPSPEDWYSQPYHPADIHRTILIT